jgi:arginine repressor
VVETAEESPFRKVQGLILDAMPVGDHVIFMNTRKGAGLAVAAAIDESRWEELAAVVAGVSTVVLLTENRSRQALLMYRTKCRASACPAAT